MALNKRRGRPPKKSTVRKQSRLKLKKHWLDCCECGLEGAEVDGDVTSLTCARCVQKSVAPPPTPKPKISAEEKELRAQLREEKRKAKLEKKSFGFGRGWHRNRLFTAEIDGKMRYFSFGKEVTKTQYKRIEKKHANSLTTKTTGSTGWGRGWHLKGEFVAPTGDVYSSGSLVKKAPKEPTLAELNKLMEQHS